MSNYSPLTKYLQIAVILAPILNLVSCLHSNNGEDNNITLSGSVLDLKGQPVPNALVTIMPHGANTQTNSKGGFQFLFPPSNIADSATLFNKPDTIIVSGGIYLEKRKFVFNYKEKAEIIAWNNNLRLSNEVSGWRELPEKFVSFMGSKQLYTLINGGADFYLEEGLVDGIYQKFDSGQDYSIDVFLFNFGNLQNAQKMYAKKTAEFSPGKLAIPGFTQAAGKVNLGGAIIYAHFGKFNVELELGGYGSNVDKLTQDAGVFLQVYQNKLAAY